MIRAAVLAAVLSLAAVAPAAAHGLNVFASVDGNEVVVEAKFSSGKVPVLGIVRVYDGADMLVSTLDLGEDGTVRFPLTAAAAESGLRIVVETGESHGDYWILTPADIAAAQETGG